MQKNSHIKNTFVKLIEFLVEFELFWPVVNFMAVLADCPEKLKSFGKKRKQVKKKLGLGDDGDLENV